jgi:hypothetical protein
MSSAASLSTGGVQLQPSPYGQGPYPWEIEGGETDLALKEVYEANNDKLCCCAHLRISEGIFNLSNSFPIISSSAWKNLLAF